MAGLRPEALLKRVIFNQWRSDPNETGIWPLNRLLQKTPQYVSIAYRPDMSCNLERSDRIA